MAKKKNEDDVAGDVGQAEVQEKMDEATEQGFVGTVPDETPNDNYTVGGVTSGAPTPETEDKTAEGGKKK